MVKIEQLHKFFINQDVLVDANFYAKGLYPFIESRRSLYMNVFEIFNVKGVALFFKLEFMDSLLTDALIAMFFFLKYLFLQKPYFYPVKVMAGFKKKAYNCMCVLNLKKHLHFVFLMGFLAPISVFLGSSDFKINRRLISNSTCGFSVYNLSFLRFVEIHPIFFR